MMLSRQAHCGVSVRRAATLRSLAVLPRRSSSIQSQNAVPRRQYVVTRQTQPWRRGSRLGLSIQDRTLATAIDDLKFDGMPPASSIPPFHTTFGTFDLHNFDPSLPLKIPEPSAIPRTPTKTNTLGVPGETDDMLAVFDACIRVGKLTRAALVLKRLNAMGSASAEEQIVLNNQYLRASLNQMRTSPDPKQAEKLHTWYELQIRGMSLPHTAETVACMLKASLLSERGPRLERLVRRYMGMAPGEAGLRVLSMDDILSDQDLAVITDICPTYNFVEEAAEMDDVEGVSTAAAEEQGDMTTGFQLATEAEAKAEAHSTAFPEPVSTPQKGQGLSTLKHGLGLLFGFQEADLSKLPYSERHDIQLQLERDSIGSAIMKWRVESEKLQKKGISTALGLSGNEESISQQMGSWLQAMERRIKEEVVLIRKSEEKTSKTEDDLDRCIYGPLIEQGDPSRLAAVVILSVLNLSAMFGVEKGLPISRLAIHIAKQVQEDLMVREEDLAKKTNTKRRTVSFNKEASAIAQAAEDALEETAVLISDVAQVEGSMNEQPDKAWSMQVKAQVGSILLKMLLESARVKVTKEDPVSKELISQYQPAFSQAQQTRRGKKIGVILLNENLIERLQREPIGDFIAKHLPMLVEPKAWENFSKGGFLDSTTSLVRVKHGDVEQKLYARAAIRNGDMVQVFKGLDVLGKTAWIINKDVLNVMLEAWNTGDEIANFPPLVPDLEIPPEPDSTADPLLRTKWVRTAKAIENERSGLHSQRCFMNLQLEIARAFRNQTIYFPHNIDYRGRAYPMPTYLNHMGADHARAMLKFSQGKELGDRGLRWLKIHLANLYGFDKASFKEREAFTDDNVANIIESATNPLAGSRWWLKAEDPWQCLATCFELKAAFESPDPTKFVSHLPVHQDGTCNGLQHYAALGGDTWGARQVNLEPGERPADVYTAVANMVKESMAKDASEGNPFAKLLLDKITRKVVKQTVMTNVYGVTFAGAKKQVCKQIDALYPTLGKDSGIPHLILSTYIAKLIFTALATMFRGAHDIQYWLGEIGGRVCRALTASQLEQIAESYAQAKAEADAESKTKTTEKGRKKTTKTTKTTKTATAKTVKSSFDELTQQFRSTVVWTTPLRMPVVQPYRKVTTKEVRTCLQSISYPSGNFTDPVHRRKQLQGFPPNFIHSLDASHMLLSALECNERGLDFAAVHDSFWTHACDVDVMSEVLREAFIRIHEEDVVSRLATEFEARHRGSVYLAYIDADSAVAKKIKALRKTSGLTAKEELLLEHKRNHLRLSGSPWDVEAARKIVTPAAVFEEMSAAGDAHVWQDDRESGLGEIAEEEEAESAREDQAELMRDSGDEGSEIGEFSEGLLGQLGMNVVEANILEANKRKRRARKAPVPVWMPLTIPAIPKKGDFDVKRLRDSQYFFS